MSIVHCFISIVLTQWISHALKEWDTDMSLKYLKVNS